MLGPSPLSPSLWAICFLVCFDASLSRSEASKRARPTSRCDPRIRATSSAKTVQCSLHPAGYSFVDNAVQSDSTCSNFVKRASLFRTDEDEINVVMASIDRKVAFFLPWYNLRVQHMLYSISTKLKSRFGGLPFRNSVLNWGTLRSCSSSVFSGTEELGTSSSEVAVETS